jgi:hypothetical protein
MITANTEQQLITKTSPEVNEVAQAGDHPRLVQAGRR